MQVAFKPTSFKVELDKTSWNVCLTYLYLINNVYEAINKMIN